MFSSWKNTQVIIIILSLMLFCSSNSFFNPIVEPFAIISEIRLDDNTDWELEISFAFGTTFLRSKFDSICVETLSGFSKINIDSIKDGSNLFVVTNKDLSKPIKINKKNEVLKLYSYTTEYYEAIIDSLIIGNSDVAMVDSLSENYSVTRLDYTFFSKDLSPTFGFSNDTSGTCATLKGKIYDKNNSLVSSAIFHLDNEVKLADDGSFSTRVFSRNVSWGSLSNHPEPNMTKKVIIDTIKLSVEPDSVYSMDIHLITDYIVGIEEEENDIKDYKIKLYNYPNPFNSTTNFLLEIPNNYNKEDLQINIFNINGQKIQSLRIKNNSQTYWDGRDFNNKSVASGTYYYQLQSNKKVLTNGSMILLK